MITVNAAPIRLDNMTRRDDELLYELNRTLAATGYPQLQQVRISVHEGFVCLRGSVTTYYEKQLAQESAKRLDGVETLNNEIVVL